MMRWLSSLVLILIACVMLVQPASSQQVPQVRVDVEHLESIEGETEPVNPEVVEAPSDPDPVDLLHDDIAALNQRVDELEKAVGELSAEVQSLRDVVAKLKAECEKPTPAAADEPPPLLKRARPAAPVTEPIKATLLIAPKCVWCDKFKTDVQPKLEALGWAFTAPEQATSGFVPRLRICSGSGCVEIPNGPGLFDVDYLQARVPRNEPFPVIKSALRGAIK